MGQCAAGLAAAHELGIVHRDLKPDNIMVVAGKDREIVKLVDFGIAKAVEGSEGQRVTQTGFEVGTPEYMAPEQLSGDPLDARVDQYALALVLYRLITGRLPFDAGSIQETLVKRLTSLPQPLAAAHPGATFPAGLQGVMDTALARTPGERYGSVMAFAAAVNEVSTASAVATRKLGRVIPPTRPTPLAPRRRRSRVALAATAVAIVSGGTWGVMQWTGAPADAGDGATGDSSSKPNTLSPFPRATSDVVVPTPPPTSPQAAAASAPFRGESVKSAEDTLSLPEPEDFDHPARRQSALARAHRILESERQPPRRRAASAALLGGEALDRTDRAEALRLYFRANLLYPTDGYRTMIRRLQDSTPE